MKFIAHRGNYEGKNKEENHPDYIDKAIKKGYDCEIDLWYIYDEDEGRFFLGHDQPLYEIDEVWLQSRYDKLWIHCKNFNTLVILNKNSFWYNYFWHESDRFTLTSYNYIWKYPEIYDYSGNLYAICGDYKI